MKPHDQELARYIDAMDEGERRELLGVVKAMRMLNRHPPQPDAD